MHDENFSQEVEGRLINNVVEINFRMLVKVMKQKKDSDDYHILNPQASTIGLIKSTVDLAPHALEVNTMV